MSSAELVKKLRESTGAGMMSCKDALVQCNGDFEEAVKWLRKKGIASLEKKSSRVAKDGVIGCVSSTCGKRATVIEINSETDFVARNEDFLSSVDKVLKLAISNKIDNVDDLELAELEHMTVKDFITDLAAKMGENINIKRMHALKVHNGVIATYVHSILNTKYSNLGKIIVLIGLESDAEKEVLLSLGKDIAMHIAAANPKYISQLDVPQNIIDREKEIITAQSAGKPSNVVEKMIDGRIRKFFEEVVLEEQYFVKDSSMQIKQLIENESKKLGISIKIKSMLRLVLGEDI